MIKHIAWDYSVINNVLGTGNQKTTKTLCNRRVSMSKISSDNPTCEECISQHNEDTLISHQLANYQVIQ
jgi:hypothetical protein